MTVVRLTNDQVIIQVTIYGQWSTCDSRCYACSSWISFYTYVFCFVENDYGNERWRKIKEEVVGCDMRIVGVCVDDVGDRVRWWFRTQMADPK